MWFFGSPNLIVFGEEALEYLREVEGKRIFIVTGKTVTRLGLLDLVLEQVKETGMELSVFGEVERAPLSMRLRLTHLSGKMTSVMRSL
jgi:alcohol dehydrogenase class IV